MKGKDTVIAQLNSLLAEELTATNQYIVHAEMCENWGYDKLHEVIMKRAIVEMKHAEKIIARILFLEGRPVVSKLNAINIGQDVPKQFESDLGLEHTAVGQYNAAIALCVAEKDAGTKEMLDSILKDEEGHVDELEAYRDQLAQMGVQIFLSTKA